MPLDIDLNETNIDPNDLPLGWALRDWDNVSYDSMGWMSSTMYTMRGSEKSKAFAANALNRRPRYIPDGKKGYGTLHALKLIGAYCFNSRVTQRKHSPGAMARLKANHLKLAGYAKWKGKGCIWHNTLKGSRRLDMDTWTSTRLGVLRDLLFVKGDEIQKNPDGSDAIKIIDPSVAARKFLTLPAGMDSLEERDVMKYAAAYASARTAAARAQQASEKLEYRDRCIDAINAYNAMPEFMRWPNPMDLDMWMSLYPNRQLSWSTASSVEKNVDLARGYDPFA